MLGCAVPGAHLHVRRRDNPNGAWAKSRRARPVPVDELLVLAYDTYWFEREECRPARRCDFVLVNLLREPLGAPMRPGALNELLAALSRRAELAREVHPHMLRHCFGSNVLEAGGALDEAQALLGHASAASTQVYLNPHMTGSGTPSTGSPPARCRERRGDRRLARHCLAGPAGRRRREPPASPGSRLPSRGRVESADPDPRALARSSAAGLPGLPRPRLPGTGAAAGHAFALPATEPASEATGASRSSSLPGLSAPGSAGRSSAR